MSIKSFSISLGLIFLIAGLVLYPSEAADAAKSGLMLCADSVIPALFPFFVLSGYIMKSGIADYAELALRRIMGPLFKLNGACAAPVALGIIGGYPIGAYTAVHLYKNHLCTKNEANRLLAFCNNSGPAFILGAVGCAIFYDIKIGALLFFIHVIASLIIGIASGIRGGSRNMRAFDTLRKPQAFSFSSSFSDSVSSALKTCLNISAFIVFFAVVLRLLNLFYIIPVISGILGRLLAPLGLSPDMVSVLLTGTVEMTTGLFRLSALNLSIQQSFTIAAFILGFAGFSIHAQTISFISGSGLSIRGYILGKLFHGTLSAVIAIIVSLIIPLENKHIAVVGYSPVFNCDIKLYVLVLFFTLITLCSIAEFMKKMWKKPLK